jgi:5'/3'-nucleotidase SurE
MSSNLPWATPSPLRVRCVTGARRCPGEFEAYRVNGTPADCVALGTYLWEWVNLVLSGINLGPNLGSACWHSGTLAAAKQAALLGCSGSGAADHASAKRPAKIASEIDKAKFFLITGNLCELSSGFRGKCK